jgi:hypothetical protein
VYLVLLFAKEGVISLKKTGKTIDAMLEAGWYCTPEVYAEIVQKLGLLNSSL